MAFSSMAIKPQCLPAALNPSRIGSKFVQAVDSLRDIELLFDRELYDLCYFKWRKAEELATNYEKLPLPAEVLSWKRKLAMVLSSYQKEIHSQLQRESDLLLQVTDLNPYWQHTTNLASLIGDDSATEDLMSRRLDTTLVLQSKVLHYHILYGLSFIKGDMIAAERSVSDLIELLEVFPDRIKDDPHAYVTAISNKVSLYHTVKRWDEIPPLLGKIRDVPSKIKQSKFTVKLWIRTYNVELEMYRDSKRPDEALPLIAEIELFISQHLGVVTPDYLLLFYYQFANIYFLRAEFGKSLHWVDMILNERFEKARMDIQCYARILNLMVHFELNNILVLRYALDTVVEF